MRITRVTVTHTFLHRSWAKLPAVLVSKNLCIRGICTPDPLIPIETRAHTCHICRTGNHEYVCKTNDRKYILARNRQFGYDWQVVYLPNLGALSIGKIGNIRITTSDMLVAHARSTQ